MRTLASACFPICLLTVAITACASQPYEEAQALPTAPDPEIGRDTQPVLPACANVCALGVFQCESTMAARVCERNAEGCPSWTSLPCAEGARCDGDVPTCLGTCTNACPAEGVKQCATDSTASVLVCTRTELGCLEWQPTNDCSAGTSCKDGACVAGCKDDAGCDATTINRTRCSTFRTASQRCVLDGACHRWKTEKIVPQQCTGSGAYACSGLSAKKSCKVSLVGACIAHEITTTACPAGTICVGSGSCEAVCPPSDGCDATKVGTTRCKASSTTTRQTCQRDASSCYRWIDSATCINGTTCSAGTCSCTGCTSSGSCMLGTSKGACGVGGGACKDCTSYCAGFGKTALGCTSGACSCSTAL
jgi:hypothetical protein